MTDTELADSESRQAIEERLDLNMLVEAGAGSGKTHRLASRMAAGIVSGKYRVEEIAAVTFTRKAAAELRGRFQLALEERLPQSRGAERERIQQALANIEHLFAGTIHSFCAHLLRERPVEANIAPDFGELDEVEDQEFTGRAWRDYLARLRGQQSPLLAALQQARVSAKDLDQAFRTVCTYDEVTFPVEDSAEPDGDAVRKATGAFWRALQKLMPAADDREAKCKVLEQARRFRRAFRAAEGGRTADLAEALRCWEGEPRVTMKWWADSHEQQVAVREKVVRLIQEFQAGTVSPFLSAWRQHVYRLAMTLLLEAREFARDERRSALALSYGDLLSAAARLLRENGAVRRALQRKYRWLLVDEFQDTDPIQAEVMLLLAAVEDEEPPADLYSLHLRPGALFVVGDPKQSIYRFRRADIDVYNRVRETIQRNGGKVLPLTTSFRARPSLCEWNNRVFSALLPAAASAQQAGFSRLDPDPGWKSPRPGALFEPALRTLTTPDGLTKKEETASWDAQVIAEFIRGEVTAKRASWDDFLVLTRKRKSLGLYAAALAGRHVPAEVSGAGAFGGSPLVRALIDLLRALGDPGDAVAVVGVLRGPLFGISDRELFEHRQGGGHFGLPTARTARGRSDAGEAPSAVTRALGQLAAFRRLARTLPLPAAVERILEDSGFLALSAASGDSASAAGDVLHAVDLVRAAAEDGASLADAAQALDQAAGSSDVESVPLEPGQRQVVRVMNLHKAKGLEARVVFLADPLGAPKKTVHVRVVRDGESARGYLAISRTRGEHVQELIAHPAGWEKHVEEETRYVDAEETRLLYVAATRARELLVVSRLGRKSDAQRPWKALEPHLEGAPELEVGHTRPDHSGGKPDLSAKARKAAADERDARVGAAARPSFAVTSVTGGEKESGSGAGAETGDREEAADREEAGGVEAAANAGARADAAAPPKGGVIGQAGYRLDAGAAWGTLVHGLLEYAGRSPHATRADFERLARWLVLDTPELVEVVPHAVDLAERVVGAPFWKEVRTGGDVRVEVPFAVKLERGESLGAFAAVAVPTIVEGVIDLVHRAGDGWRILDYKTDLASESAEALLARHGRQLATYREAWERATGTKVTGTAIVALRSMKVVEA